MKIFLQFVFLVIAITQLNPVVRLAFSAEEPDTRDCAALLQIDHVKQVVKWLKNGEPLPTRLENAQAFQAIVVALRYRAGELLDETYPWRIKLLDSELFQAMTTSFARFLGHWVRINKQLPLASSKDNEEATLGKALIGYLRDGWSLSSAAQSLYGTLALQRHERARELVGERIGAKIQAMRTPIELDRESTLERFSGVTPARTGHGAAWAEIPFVLNPKITLRRNVEKFLASHQVDESLASLLKTYPYFIHYIQVLRELSWYETRSVFENQGRTVVYRNWVGSREVTVNGKKVVLRVKISGYKNGLKIYFARAADFQSGDNFEALNNIFQQLVDSDAYTGPQGIIRDEMHLHARLAATKYSGAIRSNPETLDDDADTELDANGTVMGSLPRYSTRYYVFSTQGYSGWGPISDMGMQFILDLLNKLGAEVPFHP